eukprot:TRINITY_DN17414_c0_g1_i1.p4 TRINITY_DN17414_c0_g1~~TRINITY_DN17414_c0_g1_i1.p4  ORF type:complete len:165 (+),score=36.29 TRINITY_DN17414_c0_g1_i1:108-602(+)
MNDQATVKEVRCALDSAYDKLHSGDANKSLELVLEALKLLGNNDAAINQILYKAKTGCMQHQFAKNMADMLTQQLAQLKLQTNDLEHQEQPNMNVNVSEEKRENGNASNERVDGNGQQPILCETEREMMVDLSLQHGQSFVCDRCGGVVGVDRKLAHQQFWCEK